MQAVAFSTGENTYFFVLIGAIEIEFGQVSARIDFVIAYFYVFKSIWDDVENGFIWMDVFVALVYVANFDGFSDGEFSLIGRQFGHDHFENSGFTRAIWPDDANDTGWWQFEIEVVVEEFVAEGLANMQCVDDVVTQTRAIWNGHLESGFCFAGIGRQHFVVVL